MNTLFLRRKRNSLIFAIIASFVLFSFSSCEQPGSSNAKSENTNEQISLVAKIDGVPLNYQGTWENVSSNWTSTYTITASEIKDVSMSCDFNVVSKTTVTTADNCLLVFCQVSKGTEWTPVGNFYAVALKLETVDGSQKLSISCPIDYAEKFTSLEQLIAAYPTSYNVAGNSNFFTVCTKKE